MCDFLVIFQHTGPARVASTDPDAAVDFDGQLARRRGAVGGDIDAPAAVVVEPPLRLHDQVVGLQRRDEPGLCAGHFFGVDGVQPALRSAP